MGALIDTVNGFNAELGRNLFSPFCRGVGTDLGAGISLLLGVLTTQTYAQAVLSAKSTSQARVGAVVSAVLIPIIGIFGIIVGLYMRTVTDPSTFVTSTALTSFILDYSGMPPLVAGLVLGALFIATVGTGAGLALGIATIINRELIQKNGKEHKMSPDTINKLLIVVVLAVARSDLLHPHRRYHPHLRIYVHGPAWLHRVCTAVLPHLGQGQSGWQVCSGVHPGRISCGSDPGCPQHGQGDYAPLRCGVPRNCSGPDHHVYRPGCWQGQDQACLISTAKNIPYGKRHTVYFLSNGKPKQQFCHAVTQNTAAWKGGKPDEQKPKNDSMISGGAPGSA